MMFQILWVISMRRQRMSQRWEESARRNMKRSMRWRRQCMTWRSRRTSRWRHRVATLSLRAHPAQQASPKCSRLPAHMCSIRYLFHCTCLLFNLVTTRGRRLWRLVLGIGGCLKNKAFRGTGFATAL
uniref:Uncharacterized protein n=1 Tax=Parascaris univalens TaxID=6257 RepID=A0A915A1M5_PARUN